MLWHLVEVGCVAQAMWARTTAPAVRTRMLEHIGIDDPVLLGKYIGFLAALHDLGKASPRFQSLLPEQRQRLADAGILMQRQDRESLRHSLISTYVLKDILKDAIGAPIKSAKRLANVTGAHHGRFWSASDIRVPRSAGDSATGESAWHDDHLAIVQFLRDAFDLPTELPEPLTSWHPSYPDALWLTGLISVADWIGSNQDHFCFRTEPESPARMSKISRDAAFEALVALGWMGNPLEIPADDFLSAIRTLPAGATVRAPQAVAVTAVKSMSSPGLTVIEYPMGWGKTEIALWIAAWNHQRWQVPGMYVAMPTMTTSDQLYDRVLDHLVRHLGDRQAKVNLVLTHGMAAFRQALREVEHSGDAGSASSLVQGEGEFTSIDPASTVDVGTMSLADDLAGQPTYATDMDASDITARSGQVRAAAWFTAAKRGLLAPYGVGTVDQAFMATLQTPHFFVRLFGLSGKTVIFDEVHGYDVYMNALFQRLLEWLGALGSPVVILSATLPRHLTESMLAAYARGAGWSTPVPRLAAYPRISTVDNTQSVSTPVTLPETDTTTSIRLRWMPGDTAPDANRWTPIATALEEALASGGTAAVICNTVREAQTAFLTLRTLFDAGEVSLFHARFRQVDRASIQDSILDMFGKSPKCGRPHRHILVATQVVEQSLDLDFDVMVSMFAPVDLLLQRAGRLQRHVTWDRDRPDRFRGNAELWLTGIEDAEDVPKFPRGSTAVYPEYVLLRSWLALRDRERIVIPDDVEALIESAYGLREPHGLAPVITKRLVDLKTRLERTDDEKTNTADISMTPSLAFEPENDALYTNVSLRIDPEERPDIHPSRAALTRLGPPSVSLIVLTALEAERYAALIDPDRDEPISLQDIQKLIPLGISVNNRDVAKAWVTSPNPPSWDASSHLRYRRLVVLDADGVGHLGDVPLRLDTNLGVLIDKDA